MSNKYDSKQNSAKGTSDRYTTSTSPKTTASAVESFQSGRKAGNLLGKVVTVGLCALFGVDVTSD